jgi:hypothetical protein
MATSQRGYASHHAASSRGPRPPRDARDEAAKAANIGFGDQNFWDESLTSLGLKPSATAVAFDNSAMTNDALLWFTAGQPGARRRGGSRDLESADRRGGTRVRRFYEGNYYALLETRFSTQPATDLTIPDFCASDGAGSCGHSRHFIDRAADLRGAVLPPKSREALDCFDHLAKRDDLSIRSLPQPWRSSSGRISSSCMHGTPMKIRRPIPNISRAYG